MKGFRHIMVLFFAFGFWSFLQAQGFHTSSTKIEYENGTLKLTAKFFTGDLEKSVGASIAQKTNFDSKVQSFTNSHLSVKVNGQQVPLVFLSTQTSGKSTRIYLKADNINNIKEIEVRNAMLINEFPDQQNVVTFDVNGLRKSFTAKRGNETGKVTF